MDELGLSARDVRSRLKKASDQDYRYSKGQILGSMCTSPHELAREAHTLFMEANLGDPGHFPGAAQLEAEVLADLATMLHGESGSEGRLLSGGTEANMFACYLARQATKRNEIVLPESAHFSFEKAARILNMKLTYVPCGGDGRADVRAMAAAITPKTALLVGIAGSTELGLVDDIVSLGKLAVQRKIPLHVDAAFGGYILPFIAAAGFNGKQFDFKVPGVWSIALDPHKVGMSTIPAGALVLKDGRYWKHAAVKTPYVSTDYQSTLMGTRPGSAAAATWAVHRHLGRAGFASIIKTCFENTTYLKAQLQMRDLKLVAQPELTVVTFRHPETSKLLEALEEDGMRVNVVPRFKAIRIVVNPHVDKKTIDRFLGVIDRVKKAEVPA